MRHKPAYIPDLISDIAECDANYLRLCQLFPNINTENSMQFGVLGRTDAGATVTIEIKQRCRFTTMLSVCVESEEGKPFIQWPNLEVRVYHDVKSAEVIACQQHRNFRFRYPVPNPNMFQPDEKSRINHFFGELLTHCLAHGYSLNSWSVEC